MSLVSLFVILSEKWSAHDGWKERAKTESSVTRDPALGLCYINFAAEFLGGKDL
jgi:hypothetical protein